MSRIVEYMVCFIATYSFSQGYSGSFQVSDKEETYYFTLADGKLLDPVYTIADGEKYIGTMYMSDSVWLSGIDSMTVIHQKDSLMKRFRQNFSGTYAEYTKKGKMLVAIHFTDCVEDQRMCFYPNGKPYAQFYVKNGNPSRSIAYFTQDGEIGKITDLSKYLRGEEVLVQNPWNFRMRKKMLKLTIE